jgi:hypothetical protein
MKTVIAFAVTVGSALAIGSAYAQDTAKKPEAKQDRPHQHRGMQGMNEKHRMGQMRGCPMGEPRGAGGPSEHDHS